MELKKQDIRRFQSAKTGNCWNSSRMKKVTYWWLKGQLCLAESHLTVKNPYFRWSELSLNTLPALKSPHSPSLNISFRHMEFLMSSRQFFFCSAANCFIHVLTVYVLHYLLMLFIVWYGKSVIIGTQPETLWTNNKWGYEWIGMNLDNMISRWNPTTDHELKCQGPSRNLECVWSAIPGRQLRMAIITPIQNGDIPIPQGYIMAHHPTRLYSCCFCLFLFFKKHTMTYHMKLY